MAEQPTHHPDPDPDNPTGSSPNDPVKPDPSTMPVPRGGRGLLIFFAIVLFIAVVWFIFGALVDRGTAQ